MEDAARIVGLILRAPNSVNFLLGITQVICRSNPCETPLSFRDFFSRVRRYVMKIASMGRGLSLCLLLGVRLRRRKGYHTFGVIFPGLGDGAQLDNLTFGSI